MNKRINILYVLLFVSVLSGLSLNANAQNVALSTDSVDWANLATINMEVGIGVHQHFSMQIGAKYNPWNFKTQKLGLPLYNKQKTAYVGLRYWPRNVFSGWWVGAHARYSDYMETGIWRHALDTGKALGGGLSFGYTLALHKNFNLEFGTGLWAGRKLSHTLYCCPDCMKVRESGPESFVALNDISIAVVYVF